MQKITQTTVFHSTDPKVPSKILIVNIDMPNGVLDETATGEGTILEGAKLDADVEAKALAVKIADNVDRLKLANSEDTK